MVPVSSNHQDLLILIVEDDPQLCKLMVHSIENLGIPVLTSDKADEAIEIYQQETPDLVILDMEGETPHMNIADAISDQNQSEIVLLRSTRLDDELRSKLQPTEVIYKPFDTRYLCRRIVEIIS